jgi:hypothetical protein
LEHNSVDEPSGMDWPGLPRSRLIIGADMDDATQHRLPDRGRRADLAWKALTGLATGLPSCSALHPARSRPGQAHSA